MTRLRLLVAAALALSQIQPAPVWAQQTAAAQPAQISKSELEQLLAPVALYPDELLTQVLMAATYPLEIVLAARWVEVPANKSLKGDKLVTALKSQDWDPSVKSLTPFPTVLKTMSDKLDWTQRLGDAFLAQPSDVFAAVQVLRGRAQAAGALKSNEQQVVRVESSTIIIAPAQPTTVYVPVYNPTVVYGAWPYPAYPPYYWPPPAGAVVGTALVTGMAFGVGVAVTNSLWGWGRPAWGAGNVNVNVNQFNNINVNRTQINANNWQHDASHRRGAAYSSPQLNQQFRGTAGNPANREAYRGRDENGPLGQGNRPDATRPNGDRAPPQRPNAERPNADRPNADRPNVQRPNGGGQNLQPAPMPNRSGNGGALNNVGNGGAARAQASQGHASRGEISRPNGPGAGGGGAARNVGRGGR